MSEPISWEDVQQFKKWAEFAREKQIAMYPYERILTLVAALEAAEGLVPFIEHGDNCAVYRSYVDPSSAKCSCGKDARLAAYRAVVAAKA